MKTGVIHKSAKTNKPFFVVSGIWYPVDRQDFCKQDNFRNKQWHHWVHLVHQELQNKKTQ